MHLEIIKYWEKQGYQIMHRCDNYDNSWCAVIQQISVMVCYKKHGDDKIYYRHINGIFTSFTEPEILSFVRLQVFL